MGMQVGGGSGGDELNSEINVTPFVDVMLVLLVIFMITAPMLNTGVDIALPQTEGKAIDTAEGKLILSIDKGKQLFLGKTQVSWTELEPKLASNRKVQTDSELYVEADQDIPYGVVVTAMATAKRAGIEKVMLLTDPSEELDLEALDRDGSGPSPAEQPERE